MEDILFHKFWAKSQLDCWKQVEAIADEGQDEFQLLEALNQLVGSSLDLYSVTLFDVTVQPSLTNKVLYTLFKLHLPAYLFLIYPVIDAPQSH